MRLRGNYLNMSKPKKESTGKIAWRLLPVLIK